MKFTVFGHPAVKGNIRSSPSTGRAYDASKGLGDWTKNVVAEAMAEKMRLREVTIYKPRAVFVTLTFYLPRPKTVTRAWPIGQGEGDIDKLERAILDALTRAKVYQDDSQVVRVFAIKRYAAATDVHPTRFQDAARCVIEVDGEEPVYA